MQKSVYLSSSITRTNCPGAKFRDYLSIIIIDRSNGQIRKERDRQTDNMYINSPFRQTNKHALLSFWPKTTVTALFDAVSE